MMLSCGSCIGCRIEKARQWAVRCVHEASLYSKNCFVTLTYDDRFIPDGGSLDPRHFVLFMKKLRNRYGPKIRFFQAGEYGEQLARPHHHALLFNFDFPDKELFKETPSGRLYRSPSLEELWGRGFCSIGDVTFQSASYVARYILKKITGEQASGHYGDKRPEYTTMSRRPGIGREWFEMWKDDVFPRDFVVSDGKPLKVPDYYTRLFEKERPEAAAAVKLLRRSRERRGVDVERFGLKVRLTDDDVFRRQIKGKIVESRQALFVRPLEVS